MNLLTIFSKFPDQEACIDHLENIRFGDTPFCPHCNANHVERKADGERVGRWNCHVCKSSFNVLSGTIFEKTGTPLQKWFLAVGLMVNAKKSVSSYQLARDLDLSQSTAIRMQHKVRAQMASEQQAITLQGIIEADETYVGGKPRKCNKRDNDEPKAPRGRGTRKTPVIGAVERGGNVVAQVADNLSGKGILRFIQGNIEAYGSLLITDEYKGYNAVRGFIPHLAINHQERYVDGAIHTNTIEGVWALLKRAWYGSHHHYSKGWMPLYVAEVCWKYNKRKSDNAFGEFMQGCFA